MWRTLQAQQQTLSSTTMTSKEALDFLPGPSPKEMIRPDNDQWVVEATTPAHGAKLLAAHFVFLKNFVQ